MEKIGNPFVRIPPNTKSKFHTLPIELDLYLCKSVTVITYNLCIPYNLVNGYRGIVQSILYRKNHAPISHLPVVVFVHFIDYNEPCCIEKECESLVPITVNPADDIILAAARTTELCK
jgi:hypothetical protein